MIRFFSLFAISATILGMSAQAEMRTFAIGDISSLQLREDGQYNVICKSGTFEVVRAEDVAANNVCPYVPPVVATILKEGAYHDSTGSLCDMTAHVTVDQGAMVALRLDFPECTGEYLEATCANQVCTGISFNQQIEVSVSDSTHFHWENKTVDSTGEMSWIESLQGLRPSRPSPLLPKSNAPAAGMRR